MKTQFSIGEEVSAAWVGVPWNVREFYVAWRVLGTELDGCVLQYAVWTYMSVAVLAHH